MPEFENIIQRDLMENKCIILASKFNSDMYILDK